MNTGKSNYWLLGILSITLLGLAFLGRGEFGGTLIDDTSLLRNGEVESSELRSVQGARDTSGSDEKSPCPENRPVIGWINYAGERRIRATLPEGEFASACFQTNQEAEAAGYTL